MADAQSKDLVSRRDVTELTYSTGLLYLQDLTRDVVRIDAIDAKALETIRVIPCSTADPPSLESLAFLLHENISRQRSLCDHCARDCRAAA